MKQQIRQYLQKTNVRHLTILLISGVALIITIILVRTQVFSNSEAAVGKPDLYFTPSNVTVDKNSSNTFDVFVSTNNAAVSGLTMVLKYDPTFIQDFTIDPVSPFIDLCSFSTHCGFPVSPGTVVLNIGTGLNPVEGNIKVATITYAASDTAGESVLTFDESTNIAVVGIESNWAGSLGKVTICIDTCEATPTPRSGGTGGGRTTATPTGRNELPRPSRNPRGR